MSRYQPAPRRLVDGGDGSSDHTDVGELFKFVHIWAYESLDHRAAVRAEALAKGIWPPKGRKETLRAQMNKIVLAAPFSPVT